LVLTSTQESSDDDQDLNDVFMDSCLSSEEEEDIEVVSVSMDDSFLLMNQDFHLFVESSNVMDILKLFSNATKHIDAQPGHINQFFPALRAAIKRDIPFRYDDLLDKLEQRRSMQEYQNGTIGKGKKVLVIGGGPCGLRLAIEAQLLGAETKVIEKRSSIDRNNILKLWAFVLEDLKQMGAKKLCPSLGLSCLSHISIKSLQFILLKICLLLGVHYKTNQGYKFIKKKSPESSFTVVSDVELENGENSVNEEEEEFDVVIGATGRRIVMDGFDRQSLDAKMAIAITANFRNYNTPQEKSVAEIPGLSKQYNMQFFKLLQEERSIELENIVYYKGDTHYFVMTAKKESLLKKGVIKDDIDVRGHLLRPQNIDREKLENYAREAAEFSTEHFSNKLPSRPFATWKGNNDVSIFDFTNLYRSQNACKVWHRHNTTLLTGLVGDSLLEPFWPEGTGIGQGFLGVMDTSWMIKRFFENTPVFELIREREKLYCLLRQTTQNGLKTACSKYSIDPRTRYVTTTFKFNQSKIFELYDTDEPDDVTDARKFASHEEIRHRRKSKLRLDRETRKTLFYSN